ncbi:MAG: two-component regulator propeller domain-containing protein [Bacteroidales bacterium]|nr:two-component regulator propeller domain-containing protein [Bacteroidales bacterium]
MKQFYFFALFLFLGIIVNAQSTYFAYEQALADDNVRSVEEDIYGNVWIGTTSGITKFDGADFVSYSTTDGLGGNIIYDILAHSSGNVYVATAAGMSVFDGTDWINHASGTGMPSGTIWAVEEDSNGNIWVGSSTNGVAYYDGVNWYPFGVDQGLCSNSVKVVYADRNNNVWFGTGNGISVYDGAEFKSFNTSTGLPGLMINDIIQLYNGNIAIATNGGIAIYDFQSWTAITTVEGLPAANILTLREDYNQNLWMGASIGLIKYDGTNFIVKNYDDGLSSSIVTKILITKADDNKIWAGSYAKGITVYDNADTYIIYRKNRNLISDNVQTIYVDDADITWIGTDAGINRVNDLHWRTYLMADGLTSNDISCFHKDINGNLWVGTVDGLNVIDGQVITSYTTADGLTSNVINGITSNDAGVVYIATPNMISVIDGGMVTDTINISDGLNSDSITQVHYENGRLWALSDTSIQYFDATWVDATSSGCAMTPEGTKAKCLNNSAIQYFGTDQTLRSYEDGTTNASCIAHPYSGTSIINAIADTPLGLLCSFDNGEIQTYTSGPGWTPFAVPYNVSFVADQSKNYVWIGFEANGIMKQCYSCSETIAYDQTVETCHDANNATLNLTAPLGTYEYSIDNGNNWQVSTSFNSLSGGYHHLLVRDASLSIVADSVLFIDHYNIIDDANITITQMMCNGDNNGQIKLVYSNSGSHEWENGNTTLYLRENLAAGTYVVTVSDGASCTRVLENTVVQPESLSVIVDFENVVCFGEANGNISLNVTGGTLPYQYFWSNSSEDASISGLGANDYYYTVTDANGCSVNGMQSISEPSELILTDVVDNVDCYGELTGNIDITISGGTPNYLVEWNISDYVDINNDIIEAPAGDYSVTITDDNLCSVTADFSITQPNEIEIVSADIINVYCYGDSTGEIQLETTGGSGNLSFEWVKEGEAGTFATTEDLLNLSLGVYHLTITDENFCELITDYTITQSPDLELTLDITPISCGGYEDGQILAQASGGSGTYSAYTWYNDLNQIIGTYPQITGLGPGDYKVVVRDSYYCYDSVSTTLTQAVPHEYVITPTPMSCNGLADGEILVSVDGGSGDGFTFNWQDGVAGNVNYAQNLAANEYFVTITDPLGCVEILSAEIVEPYMNNIGAFNDVEYLCYGNNLVLNPGVFVEYSWSTGSTQPTITVENADVYFVEVVDDSGCHLADTVQVIISTVFNNEDINLASVTDDNNIKLIWEKTDGEGTELYKIYRDAGFGLEYLDSKPFNEVAIYEDANVDPTNQYYSYQISAVDSCGSESDYSQTHRTCLLDVVPDDNGACWLNWGEYQGFFVVYYFIMSGTTPDNLEVVDSTLYSDFNWVEMNPNPNGTYYRIKVRRIDGCYPGNGYYYDEAFSNIVFCDNYVGFVNSAVAKTSVYPNPFSYNITLDISMNIPSELKYSIINVLGQQIIEPKTTFVEKGEQTIVINPDIASGLYVLRLEVGDEVYNKRIIKENY